MRNPIALLCFLGELAILRVLNVSEMSAIEKPRDLLDGTQVLVDVFEKQVEGGLC